MGGKLHLDSKFWWISNICLHVPFSQISWQVLRTAYLGGRQTFAYRICWMATIYRPNPVANKAYHFWMDGQFFLLDLVGRQILPTIFSN
jgi:hypothetical protein